MTEYFACHMTIPVCYHDVKNVSKYIDSSLYGGHGTL